MKIIDLVKIYLLPHKKNIGIIFISNLLVISMTLLAPYLISKYIDDILVLGDQSVLIAKLLPILLCFIIGKVASYFLNINTVNLHYIATFNLNKDLIEHVQHLPLRYFENVDLVYLNKRINDDAQDIVEFLVNNFVEAFSSVLITVGVLFALLQYPFWVDSLLIFTLGAVVVSYFYLDKRLYKKAYSKREVENRFFSKLDEQLEKVKFIKGNAVEREFINDLGKEFKVVLPYVMGFTRTSWWFRGIGDIVKYIAIIVFLFAGGSAVSRGWLTVGAFVVIIAYLNLAIENICKILDIGGMWQNSKVSLHRLNMLLSESEEPDGDIVLQDLNSIEFKDVSFSYGKHEVLQHKNMTFTKGHLYCIVGENGKGKTTLVKLLLGLEKPTSGMILYNTEKSENICTHALRKYLIAYSEQEPTLLDDSILKNLLIGNDRNISNEAINDVLGKLNLISYINRLPKRLNHLLDKSIDNISGGEKQRISQARVLLKQTPVLILDEPSSSLDVENTHMLIKLLNDLKKNKIIILVTHDKQFYEISDEIIFL